MTDFTKIDYLFGFKDRELVKTEWNGSSFFVYFKFGIYEKRINIVKECREYCKEQGHQFTKEVREQLDAKMPKTLSIWVLPEPYYKQHCHYNIGGYRYSKRVNDSDLTNNWLSKINF